MNISNRLLVISPHLDDAVLGCGEMLACHPGSVVVTVFAGAPRHFTRLTKWDAASGFSSAKEAVEARRKEDAAALGQLRAKPQWLNFCDSQYQQPQTLLELSDAIEATIRHEGCSEVLIPLGLVHSDHVLVHEAALRVMRRRRGRENWFAYEDAIFRVENASLQRRLAALLAALVVATPEPSCPNRLGRAQKSKEIALRCYVSQLRAFEATLRTRFAEASGPERCWRLRLIGQRKDEFTTR